MPKRRKSRGRKAGKRSNTRVSGAAVFTSKYLVKNCHELDDFNIAYTISELGIPLDRTVRLLSVHCEVVGNMKDGTSTPLIQLAIIYPDNFVHKSAIPHLIPDNLPHKFSLRAPYVPPLMPKANTLIGGFNITNSGPANTYRATVLFHCRVLLGPSVHVDIKFDSPIGQPLPVAPRAAPESPSASLHDSFSNLSL